MRVLKIHDLPENPMDSATPIAGWKGGAVSRTRQAIIGDGQSDNFRCNVVNFREARHGHRLAQGRHDCDADSGGDIRRGMVATEKERQREIRRRNHCTSRQAGERHRHGASMSSSGLRSL